MSKSKKEYTFRAEDFYKMREEQDDKCWLSGVKLDQNTCDISHKTPLSKGGKHEYKNIALVHKDLVKLARQLTDKEILKYAKLIVDNFKKR